MKLALILFLLTYVCMIVFSTRRPMIAVISAVLFVALGILPVSQVVGAIDWNVLMMLAGTMGTVGLFIESRMPNRMADYLLKLCPNVKWWLSSCPCLPALSLPLWTMLRPF